MRAKLAGVSIAAVAALLALPLTASGQYGSPSPPSGQPAQSPSSSGGASADVNANGNAIYDQSHLAFVPASVTVPVGGIVRWHNTDMLVPHTATEDHGLWDLAGTYGQTPANPPGFGPGETRERAFEAGTAHYYCRVHPQQMHGVVAVPAELATRRTVTTKRVTRRVRVRGRRHGRRRYRKKKVTVRVTTVYVVAVWSRQSPAASHVFDVQRRSGGGAWQPYLTGTRDASGTFTSGRPGKVWEVRARLRSADDPAKATDWSPVATVQA